jgi:hypothetical protein
LTWLSLPETVLADIARYHQAGFLHSHAAMRLHDASNEHQPARLFVTPNGFAEYFGAPRGEKLSGPDHLSQPVLPAERGAHKPGFFGLIKSIVRHI